jgi:ribulose 1,5-bisphosphate synthetase/thiazole synthase
MPDNLTTIAQKKIIIIGGGMGDLCAGAYLQRNGYEVTIFEKNSTPGVYVPPGPKEIIPLIFASTGWWVAVPPAAFMTGGTSSSI